MFKRICVVCNIFVLLFCVSPVSAEADGRIMITTDYSGAYPVLAVSGTRLPQNEQVMLSVLDPEDDYLFFIDDIRTNATGAYTFVPFQIEPRNAIQKLDFVVRVANVSVSHTTQVYKISEDITELIAVVSAMSIEDILAEMGEFIKYSGCETAYAKILSGLPLKEQEEQIGKIVGNLSGVTTRSGMKTVIEETLFQHYVDDATWAELKILALELFDFKTTQSSLYQRFQKLTTNQQNDIFKDMAKNISTVNETDDFIGLFSASLAIYEESGGGTGGGTGGSKPSGIISGSGTGQTFVAPINNTAEETKKPFTDLSEVFWAEEAVLKMYEKGIILGYPDNTFLPNNNVTRAEFVTMLLRAFPLSRGSFSNDFADVGINEWYFDDVVTAAANDILKGDENKFFNPLESIKREDMALIIKRLFELKGVTFVPEDFKSFEDQDEISAYAKGAVAELAGAGIIQGISAAEFSPLSFVTRAQAAVIIDRCMLFL